MAMLQRRGVAVMVWFRGRAQRLRQYSGYPVRRVLLATLMAITLLAGTLVQFSSAGWGIGSVVQAAAAPHGKNTFTPSTDKGGTAKVAPGQQHFVKTLPPTGPIERPSGATMTPATVALAASGPTHFVSSDKRLEVTVPAGAVPAAAVAAATQQGGSPSLKIVEIAGPSGGTTSQHISLGTYQFTLVGPKGPLAATLTQPLQLTLHLDSLLGKGALDLRGATLVIDGAAPASALAGLSAADLAARKPSVVPATYDVAAKTLAAVLPLTSTSPTGTWNTDAPQAQWSKQADTSVDLSGGNLTYQYPLDVPAGPGGLTPRLTVGYDSGAVAANHNPQGTAGWLGEGWDLEVGSISWGEQNVVADCTLVNCPGTSGPIWENIWNFSDAYGNGGELIPSDSNIAPWYDDTSASYTNTNMNWHLSTEGNVQVVSFPNPNANTSDFPTANYPTKPPCFRAFLPNGYMEEFGCTTDSLQFFVGENPNTITHNTKLIYRWDLDMIVDPSGNQIHFTYTQLRNQDKSNSASFPIDTVLSTVTYDSVGCHSTTTMCTGGSWQPAVQITLNSAYAPTRLVGAACPTWSSTFYVNSQTMRCDDVQGVTGGDPQPQLQSLQVLNDVQVQVTTTPATPSWHTLRDYQLSYEQAPSSTSYNGVTVTDPTDNKGEYVAGYTDLVKIAEIGDDGSTALPALAMGYTTKDEYYEDSQFLPSSNTNCGQAWNKGTSGTCALWSQSYNARYLTSLDNGRGWHEAFTFKLARNNTHGVNTSLGKAQNDPFACDGNESAGSPCDLADDQNWSREVLQQRVASVLCVNAAGGGCGSGGTSTLSSTHTYSYFLTDAVALECSTCTEDMYWGDQNDGDYLDGYNAKFAGFYQTDVTSPDGSLQVYTFNSTMGYGVATSNITCKAFSGTCYVAPWTDPRNALHGRIEEEDDYDTNDTTLLKQTVYTYNTACPAPGVAASAHNTDITNQYPGQNTSELDPNNPIAVCEITPATTRTYAVDGGAALSGGHATVTYSYSYDGSGHLTTASSDSTTNNSGGKHIVQKAQYAWDDAITRTASIPYGTYLVQFAGISTTEDGSGNVKACTYSGYDGGTPGAVGSQASLTRGLTTETDRYSANCTAGSLSGKVTTTAAYDVSGNPLAAKDADANGGVSGHTDATDCTYSSVAYSACAQFDGLYTALPTRVTNALGQQTNLNYVTDGGSTNSPDATNGWGQWLITSTDANSATTTSGYDALGRLTGTAKPGDVLATSPTTTYAYPVTCSATGAQEPCTALTAKQQLSSGVTVTSATYYDGWGRAVETVTPEAYAVGQCIFSVTYTMYDPAGRTSFVSDPYFVAVTQADCTPSYRRPDATQPGTQTSYDGLGRTLTTKDPLTNTTTTSYASAQPQGANVTDTSTYEATTVIDANSHKTISLTDGFGRQRYVEHFTGNGTYALYSTARSDYDWLGNVTAVYGPNSGAAGLSTTSQTTATYDLVGQATASHDADLGNYTFTYDPDGNLTESVNPHGASGTIDAGYDGLDRQIWRNTTNTPTGAYVTYTYDSTAGGNDGVGRLTGEAFNAGASLGAGSYAYTYDARGQHIAETITLGGTPYSFGMGYNDAGQPTSTTYSDGELLGLSYSAYGWLGAATATPSGGGATTLFSNVAYSGVGGAAMRPTAASVDNGTYTYGASFDNDLRLATLSDVVVSTSATIFSSARAYDNVGNVAGVQTTLAAGTDHQAFCYDEQDRLTWASAASGTIPCGGTNTAGTLASAAYTQCFAYDALNRLTSGPLGSYTYGDSGHLHAATAAGSGYTADYDSDGDMKCRAPTSATTCAGTSTGAKLTYDNERRLKHWQNTQSSPTVTDDFAYDGEGNRVAQKVNGSTITYYLGALEEITGATLTKYYAVAGLGTFIDVGGTLSSLATDGVSSVSEALNSSGGATAQQLFAPYGTPRYASGTMPTAKAFTGQRADATSGLDYYGARYYDPALGRFAGADSVADGLDRYAYTYDDPTSATDPTGHITCQEFRNKAATFVYALAVAVGSCAGGGVDEAKPAFRLMDNTVKAETQSVGPATIGPETGAVVPQGSLPDAQAEAWQEAHTNNIGDPFMGTDTTLPADIDPFAPSTDPPGPAVPSNSTSSGGPNPSDTSPSQTETPQETMSLRNQQLMEGDSPAEYAADYYIENYTEFQLHTADVGQITEAWQDPTPPPAASGGGGVVDENGGDDPISSYEDLPWWEQLLTDFADDGE